MKATDMLQPQVSVGRVRHARLEGAAHAFEYPVVFLMLPMRALRQADTKASSLALPHQRWAPLSFRAEDHGLTAAEGPTSSLGGLPWLEALLMQEGIEGVDGEVWLQTLPRMFGMAFKPVSFWYCTRRDGSLRAVVVEVNNTFGDRHVYVLSGPEVAWGQTLQASKVFHVSPFFAVDGAYRFRFWRTAKVSQPDGASRVVARIELWRHGQLSLTTSMSGSLQVATPQALRSIAWRYPWSAAAVLVRIHWQALQLWRRGLPIFSRPTHPKLG